MAWRRVGGWVGWWWQCAATALQGARAGFAGGCCRRLGGVLAGRPRGRGRPHLADAAVAGEEQGDGDGGVQVAARHVADGKGGHHDACCGRWVRRPAQSRSAGCSLVRERAGGRDPAAGCGVPGRCARDAAAARAAVAATARTRGGPGGAGGAPMPKAMAVAMPKEELILMTSKSGAKEALERRVLELTAVEAGGGAREGGWVGGWVGARAQSAGAGARGTAASGCGRRLRRAAGG